MIKIKDARTWTERADHFPLGTLRIYVGALLCGRAIPVRGHDLYNFSSMQDEIISCSVKSMTIDEILDNVNLSIKEFIKKISS